MIDTERVRAAVLAQGTPVQIAQMQALLMEQPAPKEIARALMAPQQADGGFPGPDGGASDLLATCSVLAEMRALPPLGGSPAASRALSFLRRTQGPDGSWAGDPVVTAEALFALALMDPTHQQPARLAAGWLVGEEVEGVSAVLRAAALWLLGARPGRPLPDWALGRLGSRAVDQILLPPLPHSGPDLAVALARCGEAALGGKWHRPLQEGLGALAADPPDDVVSLLHLLTALHHTGYLADARRGTHG